MTIKTRYILFVILIFILFIINLLNNSYLKKEIKNSSLFIFPFKKIMEYQAKNIFKDKNTLKKIRILIKSKYILNKEQVFLKKNISDRKFDFIKNNDHKIFLINYYGVKHYGILEQSSNSKKKKLLIYIQGHGGNPYSFSYFTKIKNFYLSKGYDVFALSMSLKGFNDLPIDFPGINKNKKKNHYIFEDFHDPLYPQKKPLSLMLTGNYYLIKEVLKSYDYEKIYAVGISGGGWYVTILSSIIEEINQSYSFAGTIPKFLKIFKDNRGDWEQDDSELYKKLDYWHLYALSILDKDFDSTRSHYQVYNINDPCCFMRPYSKVMKYVSDKINYKKFQVYELNQNKHEIDYNFLFKKLY